jgi:tetratricopeptide (TPR) repeat protein/O-antigen ligase
MQIGRSKSIVKLSRQFYNNVSQVILLGVMLAVVIGGTNLRIISLNTRTLITVFAALSFGIVVWAFIRCRTYLQSPTNYGWLALIVLTGVSVALAPFPRRSIEHWLLTIGIQLPFAYATLVLFRRVRIERIAAVYRAILGVGAYLFLLATLFTLSYLAQIDPQAEYVPGFRLWGVLDNPSLLGMFIAIALPCAAGYLFTRRTRSERILIVIWLFGALLTIVVNATRSAFIATVVGVGVTMALVVLAHPSKPLVKLKLRLVARRAQTLAQITLASAFIVAAIVGIFALQSSAPNHAPASSRFELYSIATQTFFEKPLTGYGAGNYVLALQQHKSTPPFILVPHAHNMVLDVAAEYGILGLVGLAIFGLAAGYTCWRAWRVQELDDHRVLLAGLIGGLAGFFASGLLEQPMAQTGLFFLATILLMTITAQVPAQRIAHSWHGSIILVLNSVVIILAGVTLLLYTRFWNAIQPNPATGEVDWVQASTTLDQLSDPNDPLTALQTAYALANTPNATNQAIEHLEAAMVLDPHMSMHPVNLASLYAEQGNYEQAIVMAQRATSLAPEHAAAWLNLGIYYEEMSDSDNAITAYHEALRQRPDWLRSVFWQSTEVRQNSLNSFVDETPLIRFYKLTYEGDLARDRGDALAATQAYHDALMAAERIESRTQPFYVQTALGLAALNSGHNDAARRAFLPLALGFTESSIVNVDAWVYLGDVFTQEGDDKRSIEAYQQAYASLSTPGFGGYRTQGDITYSINAFRRLGAVSDYLPGVVLLDTGTTHQARFDQWLQQVSNSN